MKEEKITWKKYPRMIEQVRNAVIRDLNSLDPNTSILKVLTYCRDNEDRFDLCCNWDFSPYMDGIYRRFYPDVVKYIEDEYKGLISWYCPDNYRIENLKKFVSNEYSAEQIYKKFYVKVTKYVEIENKLTILYSADFTLKGEVISIDDPTGYYNGFDYHKSGYPLSDAEQMISDHLSLFWYSSVGNLPYQTGDLLYIDGSPYIRPYYAVHCGEKLLYIQNIEQYNIAKTYDVLNYRRPFSFIGLKYGKWDLAYPFYDIKVVNDCNYRCLVEASKLLKEQGRSGIDIKEKVQPIFEEEFKEASVPVRSSTQMKDITQKLLTISDNYPELPFTEFMDNFFEWVGLTKNRSVLELDDRDFSNLLTEYFESDCEKSDRKRKRFQQLLEDRDMDWSDTIDFV